MLLHLRFVTNRSNTQSFVPRLGIQHSIQIHIHINNMHVFFYFLIVLRRTGFSPFCSVFSACAGHAIDTSPYLLQQ